MGAPPPPPRRLVTLRIAVAPDPAAVRAAAGTIRRFLAEQGLPPDELFPFELCLAEAGNNALVHARGPRRDLPPVAEALLTPELVELRMTDHTAGFVLPENIPPPSPTCGSGRGLFIIRSLMDEVHYLRGTTENTLVMRKRRRARPPGSPERPPAAAELSPEESHRQLTEAKSDRASMAGELSFRTETLSAIFRCCAELGRSDADAAGFGQRLLADLFHLTTADWCVLRLRSPGSRKLVVAAVSGCELPAEPMLLPPDGTPPRGIEVTVAATLISTRFSLAGTSDPDEPLRAIGPVAAGLVCPLTFGGALVGTIAVGRRDGDFPSGGLQEEVVRVLAEFLAIQTVTLRHHKEEVRHRLVSRELEIAREIQHLLLPRSLPQLQGYGLAGGSESAREVGGDFYDALAVDVQSLFLMVADVMGKGVPAALFAATMRGLLRGLAARSDDPATILSGLNRLLYAELSAVNMFITAQVVHVDLQSRRIAAASAGHCPLLYLPPGRRSFLALPTQGLPIGVLPNTVYRPEVAVLGESATLLLHTDGLTDCRNPAGELFGQRRLLGWLGANAFAGRSAAELRDRLAGELAQFRGEAEMDDDQAFLLLAETRVPPAYALGDQPHVTPARPAGAAGPTAGSSPVFCR